MIQKAQAMAEKWAAWEQTGWAPHAMYAAGQTATARSCAEELQEAFSLLPTHNETRPEPKQQQCEWFSWMGGQVCEDCGYGPALHKGIAWLAPDSPVFGPNAADVHVLWSDYGPGRELNVPLFTSCIGEDGLVYLQGLAVLIGDSE